MSLEEGFGFLLKRYNERLDLQNAFPEVRNSDFQRLINWAAKITSGTHDTDEDYELLLPFREWFHNYECTPISNDILIDETLKLTKFSSNKTLRNTIQTDITEHLPTLFFITVEFNLRRVLELGVREGFSTIALTEAVSQIGGHLWSVDLDYCGIAKEKIKQLDLNKYWTFIQGNSIEIGKNWTQEIDHLFIDSAHYYKQTLSELTIYEKFLSRNGFITFHDTKSFPGVLSAIRDFLKTSKHSYNFYNYSNNHGFGILRRIK